MQVRTSISRLAILAALLVMGSCGGGGGGEPGVPEEPASCTVRAHEFMGVCSGFPDAGNLNWDAGGDGSGGVGDGGASGDGGVGAGGDFGQFRNARITVYREDGTELGSALTDSVKGMVTIRPGASYRGSLRLELRGGPNAEYFEEGKNRFVPFPADRVIRVIVPRIDKNIGITVFTEAAYQLLTQGSAPESVGASPTPAQIRAANKVVAGALNEHFPKALEVEDITRLPFIKSDSVLQGTLGADKRGIYGVVSGAFSKQAALFNSASATPTLDAVDQLSVDLRDGRLDGRNGNAPAAAAERRTYDPQTLAGELTSALAHQAERFGNSAIKATLPELLNYGGTRYEGYLFDGSITRDRGAQSVVVGWLAGNAAGRQVGDVLSKSLPAGQSALTMIANLGHGGAFFKIDSTDTTATPVYRVYALGDNVNGELGTGNRNDTNLALVEVTLPGPLTHAAGGIAHTVFRLADGRVFAVGDNTFGQLGQGVDGTTLANSTTLLQVNLPAAAGGAVAVAATSVASYALMADGTVYSWGSNGGFGLLGNGQAEGLQTTPAPVAGLTDVVQISARDNDAVALRRDQTLLQWGSHPADANAFTAGEVSAQYRGGTFTPTLISGVPTTVTLPDGRQVPMQVRKVITEQGLFAVLLNNGHVYSWGVHFDLSAKAVLRDTSAERVLGLPPLRDLMPGGFVGYGARPFDRLTAMGVDYRGGMWKIRGRVAERFIPGERPPAQRRPQTDAPRSANCQTCHTYLDQPLETLRERQLAEAPVPASAAVCLPPPSAHQSPAGTSFIHAETECVQCHNPAQLNTAAGGQLPAAFASSGGWPNCNVPTTLPPRRQVLAATITAECTVPVGHVFTPPSTVCANCHNSVVARPLQDLVPPCIQPGGASLPTLAATATIVTVTDGSLAAIADGAYSRDTTVRLQGTLSAALSGAQTLAVTRNGAVLGNAIASGTGWTYTDAAAPQGTLSYTVRVVQGTGFGAASNSRTVRVDSVPPPATPLIASLVDDVFGVIADGGFATDSTPTLTGSLNPAPDNGDVLQVLRNSQVVGNATVSASSWTFTEAAALTAGSYRYQLRVQDAAGNLGSASATRDFTLIGGVAGATITAVRDDANAPIAAGSITRDATPALSGSVTATLPAGHVVVVLRNGAVAGNATITGTGTTWSFTDNAPQGAVSYAARVQAGAVLGGLGAAVAFTVDSVTPTQAATVTQISDDFIGALAAGATTADQTPTISGTLSAALGAGEQVRLRRTRSSGEVVDVVLTPAPTGQTWSYTEGSLVADGTYSYRAQVFDAAGNTAAFGAPVGVTLDATALPLPNAGAAVTAINGVLPTGAPASVPANRITTPVLTGTLARALLSGEVVRVFRNGTALPTTATIAVGSQSWSFTNSTLANGTYTFEAQLQLATNAAVFGQMSASAAVTIDATAPTQLAAISGIFDAASVAVGGSNTSTTTPRISGTLSAPLGSGETLTLQRTGPAGVSVLLPTVGASTWTLTESSALPLGSYSYAAAVVDGVGPGPVSTQTVNIIAPLGTAAISDVVYSAGLVAPRSDGTVVASGQPIADTTPTVRGTLGATLPNASTTVAVYRSGALAGTATVSGTGWTFVDANVGQGPRTYTARLENGTAYGATSGTYTVTVDTVAPAQTFAAISGRTTIMPNNTRPGGNPPDDVLVSGSATNDPAPQLRIQLGSARAAGESFVLRRNGAVVAAVSESSCGTNCFLVHVPAPVALPQPFAEPNTTTSIPTLAQAYTFALIDAAGNEGSPSNAFNITFDYFACDPVRAYFAPGTSHTILGQEFTGSTSDCWGCHAGPAAAVRPTPVKGLVAAPSTNPTYWCRRP